MKDSDEDYSVRPLDLSDFTGQSETLKNLSTYIRGAKRRDEPLDHILFYGPPGLGKTTLSRIISEELEVGFKSISAPAISKPGELASILVGINYRDVLFIDEIHRLPLIAEELLYGAMEDNKISILVGNEFNSEPIEVDIQPFTLVAATTRKGMLSQPLNDRFGIQFRMDFYSTEDLAKIVHRASKILHLNLTTDALNEVAKRSRGTPRIALRLLRRLRDFIEEDKKQIDLTEVDFVSNILNNLGISEEGLDETDQRYLRCLKDNFNGGPVGIETLAASMAESRDTIESVIEPFLLRSGYILRTPRGRKLAENNENSEQLGLI